MYTFDYLEDFTRKVFEKMGCSPADAAAATKVFMMAERTGLPSHGMTRLKDYYELWKADRINVKPDIRIVHESPSTAVVDADGAIGMIAGTRSMEIAIEKAKTAGTGWVSTKGSNHYGIASYYTLMAIEHDMIGISMTIANPLVSPTWSVTPMLGTNPIAVAVPAKSYLPFSADLATTSIARGKLMMMAKKGEKVPHGFVQDKDGVSSDNPDILKEGGSILPLGGPAESGGHKGYALGAIVDIFSSVLSGANFGPFCPPSVAYLPVKDKQVGEGTGHFFGAMRVDAFQKKEDFLKQMDLWMETFRGAKPAKGHDRVYIPGEMEHETRERLGKQGGVEVLEGIQNEMKIIADELGIDFEIGL